MQLPFALPKIRARGFAFSRQPQEQTETRLLSYAEWYRNSLPAGYAFPRHIEFLCGIVQKIIDGDLKRVAISTPPGHAKSETITRRLPVYWGQRHPKDAIVFTGYNQTFAEKNLSKPAREIARELGLLSPATAAMDQWELTNGARLLARGVGQAPTGVNPISLLVADDPIRDREQASSQVERDNIWDWWQGSIVQRFFPRTAALVIATRWHEDDLIGRLKARGGDSWTFINLPAIAGENDPMGRAAGEALWPEVKPIEFLESQRKEMGDFHFEALFQGNPTPREGSFFKVSNLKKVSISEVPKDLPTCIGFDNAYTEDGGDWTAGIHMSGPDENGKFYVEPWRIQAEPSKRNEEMVAWAKLKKPRYITVPKDPAAGKEVAQTQIRMFAGFSVTAVPRHKGETKALVADPFAAQVNAGNVCVVVGPEDEYFVGGHQRSRAADYIEELRQFPGGKNDDQVDGSADAFNKLTKPKQGWNF